MPFSCKFSAMDESSNWLFAPPAIILHLRSLIESFVKIAPTAHGENKSHSIEKVSSTQEILWFLISLNFDPSISEIKTSAPEQAKYSASLFPTLPAPCIAIFFPSRLSE